jgi:SET domain-containing protein
MKYIVKSAGKKGKGLFANRNIRKGESIMRVDLSKDKSYTREQIDSNPKLQSDHCDYVGRGRYTISFHPYSYMNHSCNPNVLVKHKSITKSNFIALRDIREGEELTYDYGVNAMDQFEKELWSFKCHCGSKNCRKKISGCFFKQPLEIQKFYWKYLPLSIRKKYASKLKRVCLN